MAPGRGQHWRAGDFRHSAGTSVSACPTSARREGWTVLPETGQTFSSAALGFLCYPRLCLNISGFDHFTVIQGEVTVPLQ